MRFPTHWVCDSHSAPHPSTGQTVTRWAYGWSTESNDDARRVARDRAKRAVDFAITGERAVDGYYGAGFAREELIDSVTLSADGAGEPIAAVTRNRYGALVLNTDRVLIADIDQPRPTGSFLSRLFKKVDAAQQVIEQVRAWQSQQRPAPSYRLYRTAAGFRLILTDRAYAIDDDRTFDVLKGLGTDPLYVTLCRRQKCFRARLTPKPWRMRMPTPTSRFPYSGEVAERRQREWEDRYIEASKAYATCRLLDAAGAALADPLVAATVELHDAHTLSDGRPLA